MSFAACLAGIGCACLLHYLAKIQSCSCKPNSVRGLCNREVCHFLSSFGRLPAWSSDIEKNSRRLELSISKNIPHGRWGQGPGSVDPRFPAGLPFLVPEIQEFVAFRDSGNIFQQFSRDFPGVFLGNPRTDPGNSHSLLEFSEVTFHLDVPVLELASHSSFSLSLSTMSKSHRLGQEVKRSDLQIAVREPSRCRRKTFQKGSARRIDSRMRSNLEGICEKNDARKSVECCTDAPKSRDFCDSNCECQSQAGNCCDFRHSETKNIAI